MRKGMPGRRVAQLVFCLCLFLAVQSHAVDRREELLIGLEPEHNIFDQVERYRELAAYLTDVCGIQVRLTIMSRYGEVLERFKGRRLDGAFLNSYTAALAMSELGLEPFVRPVNSDGSAMTQAYIFARRDSGIKTVEDMRGRIFVFVDPSTTEGYLFPVTFLREHGVDNIETFLGRYYFSGSHASAVSAVLDGRADIGSAKATVYNRQVAADPSIGSDLFIISRSPGLPETTLCIKSSIDQEMKAKLAAAFVQMSETERGRSILKNMEILGFVRASLSDYTLISDMKRDAGIPTGR